MSFDADSLINSFRAAGAWYNGDAMGLQTFEGMGWGAVAKKAIEPHTPLFHIPLPYLLTPWTSALRTHLTDEEWASIAGGWSHLILCMMWEESRGAESIWSGYLANMPRQFDTPMWWQAGWETELKGTDIEQRIGRADAETEYQTRLLPVIQAHPELFPASSPHFTLESFHIQGSRILSRSFTIPRSRAGGPPPGEGEGDDEDDDGEEEEVAVMVPMADMLNAAYERDNARLFNDGDEDEGDGAGVEHPEFGEGYTMISTKPIEAGEQIYNTYASPPNSELLRKYGHVDALPLPAPILALLTAEETGAYPLGNAGDEVEITGDALVNLITSSGTLSEAEAAARVDWWLEEGQEDTFALNYPVPDPEEDDADEQVGLPPALVAFGRLLLIDEEWARAERKGKLPKTDPTPGVLDLIAPRKRYPQDIQADLAVLAEAGPMDHRKNAAAVRLGEKRVLSVSSRLVEKLKKESEAAGKKRKAEEEGGKAKRRK